MYTAVHFSFFAGLISKTALTALWSEETRPGELVYDSGTQPGSGHRPAASQSPAGTGVGTGPASTRSHLRCFKKGIEIDEE